MCVCVCLLYRLVAERGGARDGGVVSCEERDREEKSLMEGSFDWWRAREKALHCVVFIEGALLALAGLNSIG